MEISLIELKKLLIQALIKKRLTIKQAEIVANDYLQAEISGKKTHGIVKFLKELRYIDQRISSPRILIDRNSMVLIDGCKEVGQLAAKYCTKLVIKRAKKYGVAIVGIKNIQRYGILTTWVEEIANENLIGLISNSCESASVPFGGCMPVLGTNPIAIGIPTSSDPLLLDMATSKSSMSELLLNLYCNQPLPSKTFFDKNGNYCQNSKKIKSVEGFGGYKGFGLSLVLEILAGSLVTAKMGKKIKSFYDIGYYFQAIDPSIFQELDRFKKQNDLLINALRKSSKIKNKIFIPGEKYFYNQRKVLADGALYLPESLITELRKVVK